MVFTIARPNKIQTTDVGYSILSPGRRVATISILMAFTRELALGGTKRKRPPIKKRGPFMKTIIASKTFLVSLQPYPFGPTIPIQIKQIKKSSNFVTFFMIVGEFICIEWPAISNATKCAAPTMRTKNCGALIPTSRL